MSNLSFETLLFSRSFYQFISKINSSFPEFLKARICWWCGSIYNNFLQFGRKFLRVSPASGRLRPLQHHMSRDQYVISVTQDAYSGGPPHLCPRFVLQRPSCHDQQLRQPFFYCQHHVRKCHSWHAHQSPGLKFCQRGVCFSCCTVIITSNFGGLQRSQYHRFGFHLTRT